MASIEKNFRQGGRYAPGEGTDYIGGSYAWVESIRAKEQSGKTLVDTALLSTSITYVATSTGMSLGSNKVYAPIQHFGGEAGKDQSVTLPPRPYLVIQDEDYEEIQYAVEQIYASLF